MRIGIPLTVCALLTALILEGAPLASFPGALSDKTPGWSFKPSKPNGKGMTFNEFEGYYPDKGGRLFSRRIKLDKTAGESAYYRISFEARAGERAYQGVNFFDSAGNALADCYDVLYAGPKSTYNRVVYAMDKVDSIEVFFQSRNGCEAWNLNVERVGADEAARYCDRIYAKLPALKFTAPADSMKFLPKTAEALRTGKPWKVLMLGDSIMQDTYHSQFHALLKREFPNSNFQWRISIRGSTGCWYYCQADKFKQYVLDAGGKPDLVVIGGISNYRKSFNPDGADAMEIVANAIRAHWPECEVLIVSATLAVDTRPWNKKQPDAPIPPAKWEFAGDLHARGGFNPALQLKMADKNKIQHWDMTTPAYTWLYASGLPHEFYSRDFVHSGELGKQLIGRIAMEYFKTAK